MGRWVYIPDKNDRNVDKKKSLLEWHLEMESKGLYDALKDMEWKEYWRGREATARRIPIHLVPRY